MRQPTRTHSSRLAVNALFVVLSVSHTIPALAAKIYRCGNVFQDLPCADQKVADARPVEPTRTTRDSTACAANTKDATGRNDRADCTSRVREQPTNPTDGKAR